MESFFAGDIALRTAIDTGELEPEEVLMCDENEEEEPAAAEQRRKRRR